jgi:nitroreductase
MEALFARRSIRKFTAEAVDDANVMQLLRAAMAAPSAGNQQPWEFIVMRDRDALRAVLEFHPYAKMLEHAPVAIVVCGNTRRERFPGFWVQDCAAATENLLIQATALGLGSVWLGMHPLEERVRGLSALLRLPEHVIPLCLVAIGRPAETKEPNDRYEADRVHQEKW